MLRHLLICTIPKRKRTKTLVDGQLAKFCWMHDNVSDLCIAYKKA